MAGPVTAGLCPLKFPISQWMESPLPPCALAPNPATLAVKVFPNILLLCCNLCLLPLIPPLCISEKSLVLSSLHLPVRKLQRVVRFPLRALFCRLAKPGVLNLTSYIRSSSPLTILGASVGPTSDCQCLSMTVTCVREKRNPFFSLI